MKLSKLVLFSLCAAALAGCNSTNEATGLSSNTNNGGSSTSNQKDVKAIVSTGPGLNFNNQTGSWSEMALNPITKAPAVVYYDRTQLVSPVAGALKVSIMDSAGNWGAPEVIDANAGTAAQACAGGATSASCIGAMNVAAPTAPAQIYDIKFLQDSSTVARPVVAYAYGTGGASSSTTGKSIRLAEKGTDGTWTVSTVVTGTQIFTLTTNIGPAIATLEYPIKGIRLLVDDSNRIHMYFGVYSATANNSFYGYTMRKADGTWTTPVAITTTSAPSTTLSFVSGAPTFAATSGMQQGGAAWCKYTGGGTSADGTGAVLSIGVTDNTPAASTQGFLLKCATANTDGSCATWQGLDFQAACAGATPCVTTTPALSAAAGNAFGRSDIAIDPLNGKIFLSTFFAAPSLTAPVTAATGILSTLSPAACDAGLSTTAWPVVRGHITAAQGTLGLRNATDGTSAFMASITSTGTALIVNKATAALGANWDVTTNFVTVESTTNTYAGGFLYDASTATLWGSYGALVSAVPGVVGNDIKAFNAISSDVINTGIVNNTYIDQTNMFGQSTAIPMLDANIAPNGTVGYAYFYTEQGTAGPNSHLYYGVRGGAALTPAFAGANLVSNSIQGATTFVNGTYPSLTYDTNSNPMISFLDNGIATNTGYLMVARSANGGASFTLDRVDGTATAANTVGQFTSIRNSASNTTGVAYYDFSAGVQRLKFAKRTKNGAWIRYIVDGPGATGTGCSTTAGVTTGQYAVLQWTSTGRPVIVYQSATSGNKSLRIAYATEAETSSTYTWTCLAVDTSTNVRGEGIDFVLDSSDRPYIIHNDQTVNALRYLTCTSSVLSCGASSYVAERLNYLVGTVTSIVSKPTIRVDSSGKVYVAFYSGADQGLYLATKSSISSGTWSTSAEALDTPVAGTTYTSGAGQYAAMMLNSSNKPMIFYRSLENWIKYFSRETY